MTSSRDDLAGLALAYLAAAEARDLELADAHLAPDVDIVFPGGIRHDGLADVVASARERYRSVSKTVDAVDVDTGSSTVVVTGRLAGENLLGVHFVGVRFIDRFHLTGGAIDLQHVWNDLEESGVLNAASTDDIPPQHRPS